MQGNLRTNLVGAFALTLLVCLPARANPDTECVVLLHGWGRVTDSMAELATKLERANYHVANIKYPSRSEPINILASDAIGRGLANCSAASADTTHFVAHSLGGILVRYYLAQESIENLGRVVMLGPPNQGSEFVDSLLRVPGFKLIGGPTGALLGTGEQSIAKQLGPADFKLGIIAGDTNLNPLNFLLASGPSDSVVTVVSTRLEGMDAHIVLPVVHQFMMRDNDVIDHAIHFLKTGKFMHVN